jgi:hypothetical protein
MANEDISAGQSKRLGKLAANPGVSHEHAKELISTQARFPKSEDVEKVITNETNKQALGSFKRGGKVKRTGTYKLHKGEKVLTKKQSKRA